MTKREILNINSVIKPGLKGTVLIRGTVMGAIGLASLLYAALLLPPEKLQGWGTAMFIFSIGMITVGMLPYTQLQGLENNPNKLILYDDETLSYIEKGKMLLTIPIKSIQSSSYYEKNNTYGICFSISNPPPEKIIVHTQTFDFNSYQSKSRKRYGCDLFIPYFTKRGQDLLKSEMDDLQRIDFF